MATRSIGNRGRNILNKVIHPYRGGDSSQSHGTSARVAPVRIIAGEFRGRKLLPPEGDVTRPITDRVKQSLFDIIAPLIEGAIVYDCFCGTGSMGLECLSRGAAKATFFDADRSAVARLKENIGAMKVGDRAVVLAGDIFRWAAAAPAPEKGVDLLFLDPPYRLLNEKAGELQKLMVNLLRHLAANATVVFRHDVADALELPGLERYDLREYGGMAVELLSPSNAAEV
jgi:16S rRNA (guanine966-N2)-methyltransferase